MRLIISDPDTAKISTSGCSVNPPTSTLPNHRCSRTSPIQAARASKATSTMEVGIGVPSKYFTLPVPSDSVSAVTL